MFAHFVAQLEKLANKLSTRHLVTDPTVYGNAACLQLKQGPATYNFYIQWVVKTPLSGIAPFAVPASGRTCMTHRNRFGPGRPSRVTHVNQSILLRVTGPLMSLFIDIALLQNRVIKPHIPFPVRLVLRHPYL